MAMRGVGRCAVVVALVAACVVAPAAEAAKKITIEGFRAAAPRSGSPIPQAIVKPGQRLTRCHRPDAIMVIFGYSGLDDEKDRIRVNWFRNGRIFHQGRPLGPEGSDGRAFRSLSPNVVNGKFRADIILNGNLAARGRVIKACRGA